MGRERSGAPRSGSPSMTLSRSPPTAAQMAIKLPSCRRLGRVARSPRALRPRPTPRRAPRLEEPSRGRRTRGREAYGPRGVRAERTRCSPAASYADPAHWRMPVDEGEVPCGHGARRRHRTRSRRAVDARGPKASAVQAWCAPASSYAGSHARRMPVDKGEVPCGSGLRQRHRTTESSRGGCAWIEGECRAGHGARRAASYTGSPCAADARGRRRGAARARCSPAIACGRGLRSRSAAKAYDRGSRVNGTAKGSGALRLSGDSRVGPRVTVTRA